MKKQRVVCINCGAEFMITNEKTMESVASHVNYTAHVALCGGKRISGRYMKQGKRYVRK